MNGNSSAVPVAGKFMTKESVLRIWVSADDKFQRAL